jgi:hypothetical protein
MEMMHQTVSICTYDRVVQYLVEAESAGESIGKRFSDRIRKNPNYVGVKVVEILRRRREIAVRQESICCAASNCLSRCGSVRG